MDAINNTIVDNPGKVKKPKRNFKTEAAKQAATIRGANIQTAKKEEPGLAYYFNSYILLSALLGSPLEVSQDLDFAYQLDTQAKAKGIGSVTKVCISDGVFEVELKLTVTGEQSNHIDPANNAYEQLKEFLTNAPQLRPGLSGKNATWKAKVMGSTILDGNYLS